MQHHDTGASIGSNGTQHTARHAYYALSRGRARMTCLLLFLLGIASLPIAHAAEPAKPKSPAAQVPPAPPLPAREAPAPSEPDTGLEPEVTITTRDDVTYEEHRLHGRLYMVKVTPKRGKPYYLIDDEGNGQFRRSDIETRLSVPNWVIKSW